MDKFVPKAIFGAENTLSIDARPAYVPKSFQADYEQATLFLMSYRNNKETFMSFRREIERFMQWVWFFARLSLLKLTVQDIENYLQFCRKPPANWIALKTVAKFIEQDGQTQPNLDWRPFVVRLSKSERAAGVKLLRSRYTLSEKGFKEIFTILHCFYKHLIQQDYVTVNLIDRIKQKSRFYRKHPSQAKIRRISTLQWDFVIETAERMANENPDKHERTLFIMSVLYGMYLRISELSSSERWTPTMNDFSKDHEGNWWFTTVGKGNKQRNIAVSDSVLTALTRWRNYLKTLTPLPLPNDNTPLVPGRSAEKPISSTRQIRNIVQLCFDISILRMREEGFEHDADELAQATVHWLRHTGISEDVKHRPREHVRDDAGHSSSQITDRYIDIDLVERHLSAKEKKIKH